MLDQILTIQFLVAWAGEGRCEPPRLGWWATDLVDEFGGGDFLQRLLPKTHEWAAFEAVREAAKRRAEAARKKSANADGMRSLFYLGYEVDRHKLRTTARAAWPRPTCPSMIPIPSHPGHRRHDEIPRPGRRCGEDARPADW